MPNVNDLIPAKHLRAYDLRGTEPVVTIAAVVQLPLGKSRALKWVIRFVGKEKYLILNATMIRALAAIAGEETDRWTGATIQLYTASERHPETKQQVPVVRIKAPVRAPVLVKAGGRG